MDYVQDSEFFKDLTNETITRILDDYYGDGPNTKNLIQKYNLKGLIPNTFYKHLPKLVLGSCEKCSSAILGELSSKTASSSKRSERGFPIKRSACSGCGHYDHPSCKCRYCRENFLLKEERTKNKLRVIYATDKRKIDSITLTQAVLLRALFLASNKRSLSLKDNNGKLYPSDLNIFPYIIDLYRENFLSVNVDLSPLNALDLKSFNADAVVFDINIDYEDNLDFLFDFSFSSDDLNDFSKLKKDLNVAECLEYFNIQMSKLFNSYQPINVVSELFREMLCYFSVYEIYALIYSVFKNASYTMVMNCMTRYQAANNIPVYLKNYFERAKRDSWNVSSYDRIKGCEISLLGSSIEFAESVIKKGCFKEAP